MEKKMRGRQNIPHENFGKQIANCSIQSFRIRLRLLSVLIAMNCRVIEMEGEECCLLEEQVS
jgi:hypothetical protein